MTVLTNSSFRNWKRPSVPWPGAILGLAAAALLQASASAQLATDKLHGYALNGNAAYSPSSMGHTLQPGDSAIDLGTSGGALLSTADPALLSALNAAAAGDKLTVSLWVQHYAVSASSAFYFYSPNSITTGNNSARGFQAHLPWSNDNIYFDTAGCCDTSLQRINAAISTYPGWTDDSFWLSWHHFVFIKNGSDKQVWIDGNLFLEGQSSNPLPTDFNLLCVGSGLPAPAGIGSVQGLIDDFAIYGGAFSSNDVAAIATGTSPSALTSGMSTNLLAYWDFNPPAEPVFSAIQAGPGATVTPDISAYYLIANGASAVQPSSIRLGLNGTNVTSGLTILTTNTPPLVEGSLAGATIYYVSPTLFPANSTQTVSLVYSDSATPPNVYSNSWPVVVEAYNGYATDHQGGYVGFLEGSAVFTADKGGHTGLTGDRAIDLSGIGSGGDVHIGMAAFLNQGATNSMMSVSLWMKMHQISNGGMVFARSATAGGGGRGFSAQAWSDDNLYFDTAGCCAIGTQRILASITAMPNYVDDTFWTQWHHYVFSYNTFVKNIWVDGYQLDGDFSTSPLPTDFRDLFFGYDAGDNVYQQALIDDVSVFASELTPASVSALTNGVSPMALSGETLLAYWDFNTLSPGPPFVSLTSTPAPNSTNNLPNVGANILIVNRNTQVQLNTITLALDGQDVTSFAKSAVNAGGAGVTFITPTNLVAHSTHQLTVAFADNATPPNLVTNTWSFTIGSYGGYAHDVMHNYLAMFLNSSHYSLAGGGHTGAAGDRSLDLGTDGQSGATVVDPPFLAAANSAAASNILSASFWLKQPVLANNSGVWFNSPSVGRDFQAHTPYSSPGTIYFDTAGCCNAPQRISAAITTFAPYTAANIGTAWWTNWHHFVLIKNGSDKQVWIDGQMFMEGTGTASLATDINLMYIANIQGGGYSAHGQIDDFAIFGDALSSTAIGQLYSGLAPTSLGDTNLLAYWNFDDVGPAFLVQNSRSPAANATGATAYGPSAYLQFQLEDGSTAVNTNTVRLLFNGVDVTGHIALTVPAPGLTQIRYAYAPPILASGSTNQVMVFFNDNATPPNLVSNSWVFVAEKYNGVTHDVVNSYAGLIWPPSHFSPNGGGRTGLPGDYAMDMSTLGGAVHVDDATFLRPAESSNTMTISFWAKKYDTANCSAFWINSPSSSGGGRGAQAHLPYGNTIYFDTAGCCTGGTQRMSASITTFAGYLAAGIGDGWWTNWHHYAFMVNAGDKQIWIDGQLFLELAGASPLPLDFTDMYIGFDPPDNLKIHGLIDDYAVFSTAVNATNITLLAQGALPTALSGETLLAYWNFNDVPVIRPTIVISASGHSVTITFTGTLQSATAAAGPYTDVVGAPNPYTITASGPPKFYRARQ